MSMLLNTGTFCSSTRTVAFSDARPHKRLQVSGRGDSCVRCAAEKQSEQVGHWVYASWISHHLFGASFWLEGSVLYDCTTGSNATASILVARMWRRILV